MYVVPLMAAEPPRTHRCGVVGAAGKRAAVGGGHGRGGRRVVAGGGGRRVSVVQRLRLHCVVAALRAGRQLCGTLDKEQRSWFKYVQTAVKERGMESQVGARHDATWQQPLCTDSATG